MTDSHVTRAAWNRLKFFSGQDPMSMPGHRLSAIERRR